MEKIATLVMFICFVSSGCAPNHCKQYYTDLTGINASRILPYNGDPEIIRRNDMVQDMLDMGENGYIPLGYCAFESQLTDDSAITEQAKHVRAAVVHVYKKYSHTVSGTLPLFLPNVTTTNMYGTIGTTQFSGVATTGGQTQYNMPYSVDRYMQTMIYWGKAKTHPLGVFVTDLSKEDRKLYQRNPGVVVTIVVKNSPAFYSNMLQGDVIVQIEDKQVVDMQDFQQKVDKYAGQEVIIKYLRGDMTERDVKIHLNPSEASK